MPNPDLSGEDSPPDSEAQPEIHPVNSCATSWGTGRALGMDEKHPRASPSVVVDGTVASGNVMVELGELEEVLGLGPGCVEHKTLAPQGP